MRRLDRSGRALAAKEESQQAQTGTKSLKGRPNNNYYCTQDGWVRLLGLSPFGAVGCLADWAKKQLAS